MIRKGLFEHRGHRAGRAFLGGIRLERAIQGKRLERHGSSPHHAGSRIAIVKSAERMRLA
jgi:hypothetical protein